MYVGREIARRQELQKKGLPVGGFTNEDIKVEWKQLDWRKVEKAVYKLQKRIFKASQSGDVKTVRRLQKTLMKSRNAKLLAVRRVTQDNKGKSTAVFLSWQCLCNI